MTTSDNEHIRQALELSRQLIILADEGELDARDDGCILLYGVARDCAYKLRQLAEAERERHQARGDWQAPPA